MPDFGDRRVMGCSRADLRRWIAEMHGPDVPGFVAERLDLVRLGVPVTIVVRDMPARRLGLISFQELEVSFEYEPQHADAARAWIGRFDRHTQRGGG